MGSVAKTVGTGVGTAMGGPLGGFIGGSIGGLTDSAFSGNDPLGGVVAGGVNGAINNFGNSPFLTKPVSMPANAFLSKGISENGLPAPVSYHDFTYTAPKVSLLETLNSRSKY